MRNTLVNDHLILENLIANTKHHFTKIIFVSYSYIAAG